MKQTENSSERILLLSVGLLSGFLIAAALFYIQSHNSSSADRGGRNELAATAEAQNAAAAIVPVAAQPIQSVQQPNYYAAPSVQQPQASIWSVIPSPGATYVPAQSPLMSNGEAPQVTSVLQADPATGSEIAMPNTVTMSTSGSGHEYVSVTPDYSQVNPSWTTSRNGLIGNPPVDPPTSKGRAYRSY